MSPVPARRLLRQSHKVGGAPSKTNLADNPVEQFRRWFAAWHKVAVGDPNAMVVTTATPDGRPSVRIVLLPRPRRRRLRVSQTTTAEGHELAANPRAARCCSRGSRGAAR